MPAQITPFFHDKKAAVSISFDDGSYTQYRFAYPMMERYGIKGTFSTVGQWTKDTATYSTEPGVFSILKMGWKELNELAGHGHEIAAHGYMHLRYPALAPAAEIARDMRRIKDSIEKRTGRPVYTLHYPYSFTTDSIKKATRLAGYLFGRTGTYLGKFYNDYESFDPYLLTSVAYLNDTLPSLDSLRTILDGATGKWVILMHHHLFPRRSKEMQHMISYDVQHTYSVYPATFEKQLQLITSYDYWTAPVGTIGRYMYERLHTHVHTKRERNQWEIWLEPGYDTTVYDHPLTVRIKVPWKKVIVSGSLSDGKKRVDNHTLMVDALPGSRIIIRRSRW